MKKRMPKLMALVLTLVLCFGSVQSVFAYTYKDANNNPIVSEKTVEEATYKFCRDTMAGGYDLIDTDELKADIDKGTKMVIVDTMPADSYNYQNGHVPGAINAVAPMKAEEYTAAQKSALMNQLPKTKEWKTVSKSVYSKAAKSERRIVKKNGKKVYQKKTTVADKKVKVVVYCGFIGCTRSHVAAAYLVKQGYKNVYRYGGGIEAWMDANYEVEMSYNYVSASYVNSKLSDSNVVLLDVRQKKDYAAGHIAGSVSASCLSDVVTGDTTDGLAADNIKAAVKNAGKDKEYILICYSGNRYAKAATKLLLEEGVAFENIKTLGGDDSKFSTDGGMKAWEKKYPKVTDKSVTITCKVAKDTTTAHWFIVSEGGSKEKETVLSTKVSTDDFYNALETVAGKKVWNDGAVESFGVDESLDNCLAKGQGSKDFAKLNLTVSWGGKTYKLSDVVTNAKYKGVEYKGSYDIAFAGNLDNQHKAKTGCITCFGGCYMGITSGHDTPMMIEYDPANLPAVGETVTVTYTLK